MSMPTQISPCATSPFSLSDGEVDFLWWFIQGSIMDADVRARLNAHWGMCPRHALGFFIVEAAFRPHLIHGSTILYNSLMRKAEELVARHGLLKIAPDGLIRHYLRESGPCHMCSLGYGPASRGNAPVDRLAQGHNLANALLFATQNRKGWVRHVCGKCSGGSSPVLCRLHLIDAMEHNAGLDFSAHIAAIRDIAAHLSRFDRSFRWDSRDTDTDEDRGALLAAIGWCGGWQEILRAVPD